MAAAILFGTRHDAEAYQRWLVNDYVLDGTHFFDRPYFRNPECHLWNVVVQCSFCDVTHQVVKRMERWQTPPVDQQANFRDRWSALLVQARTRQLTGIWLLSNPSERLAGILYFRDRVRLDPPANDPQQVALASLAALESQSPLGMSLVAWDGTRSSIGLNGF